MRSILAAVFLCVFPGAFAFGLNSQAFIDGLGAQPMTVEADNVRLKGFRFLNADGRPNSGKYILFTHGLHSNLHEFEYMVREKMAQGFDCYAFNFRGHGNGQEFSSIVEYHDGDYGFEKMAAIDFPAILAAVKRSSGKPGFIIGHSMGGMVPRAALVLGSADFSDVEGMVLIGSPPHFRANSNSILLNSPLLSLLRAKIFNGPGDKRISGTDILSDIESKSDFLNLWNPAYWIAKEWVRIHLGLLKDLAKLGKIHDHDWARRAMTASIPKDILRSFAKFQEDYPYENANIPMPALYIAGENDLLVRATDIVATAAIQSRNSPYKIIRLKGVGHLSLVAPRALPYYEAVLKSFLDHPLNLISLDASIIEFSPSLCERALLGT